MAMSRKPTIRPLSSGASEILRHMEELIGDGGQNTSALEKIKENYKIISREERQGLFREMLKRFEVPKQELDPLMSEILHLDPSDPQYGLLLCELRSRCRSPRWTLFREFVNTEGGLKFLLDLRGDLLAGQRETGLDMAPLDADIVFLLNTIFQHGFLSLEEMNLDSSYRHLKFISDHDTVHPMGSLEEMAGRLGGDRRCFALFHRLMHQEPIIFIEVALTHGIARSIEAILRPGAQTESRDVDTAMFYSINNTQNGLTGLGLGKMLIGKVVERIKEDVPGVKNFATLSPLPGFWKRYLEPILKGEKTGFTLTREEVPAFFNNHVQEVLTTEYGRPGAGDFCGTLAEILDDPSWPETEPVRELLRKPMVEIAYHYVANEKTAQGNPVNPVASFHLANGARVTKNCINFLANPTPRGLGESCGIMANYVYSLNWLHSIMRSLRWASM